MVAPDAKLGPRPRSPAKPARAPRKRARLEVDERREQLLTIGLEAFATTAYDLVSIDAVARAARVSKGLLYHYFATKRAFYAAIVERAASQLLERTDIPASLPPAERLRNSLDAYLSFVSAHGKTYSALLSGGIGSDAKVAEIVNRTRRTYLARMLDGVSGNHPVDDWLTLGLRGWLGYVEATSLHWLEQPAPMSMENVRDHLAEVLVSVMGLAAR